MSDSNECENCSEWCGDDYDYCRDCGSEEIPVAYESVEVKLPKSWVLIIQGNEVQLPHSQCTLDEDSLKVYVPRWLAVKKESTGLLASFCQGSVVNKMCSGCNAAAVH